MHRILSILLVVCIVGGMVLPIQALADTWEGDPSTGSAADSATPTQLGDPEEDFSLGASSADSVETADQEAQRGGCADALLAPFSGFEPGQDFYTRILLTAVDREDKPVEGAKYELARMDTGEIVEELVTDERGVALSERLPVETDYWLREVETPEGYHPNHEHFPIHLMDYCTPSRIDVTVVYDPMVAQIGIEKTDHNGKPLEDVGFYIYRLVSDEWGAEFERVLVDTVYTDAEGRAKSTELPLGEYSLYEFQYPEEYHGIEDYYIPLWSEGTTEWHAIQNELKWGTLALHKRGEDGKNIRGAVFSIYRAEDDEFMGDRTTSSSGYIYFNLPLGDYYAVEKSVPEPYRLDTTPQHFTIAKPLESVYLRVTNQLDGESSMLRVIAQDDSGNPLSGAKFALYRDWDKQRITELTTGADGIAEYSPLIPQGYYLQQTQGVDGYTVESKAIIFTVDGSGKVVEVPVVNPKIRIFGKVQVINKDDAGTPISGARFGLYCSDGKLLEELVTGVDGTATSEILNEGKGYYLQELEGLAGYLPSSDKHAFDIVQNNVTVPVNVTTPRISGGVKVIKTGHSPADSEDAEGEPLAGVVFGVYKGGKLTEKLTTDEDGVAESGVLYYGDYELVELSTVEGYELLDTPIPFSILEQDVVLEIPVANPLILGTIVVHKVDESVPADPDSDGDSGEEGASGDTSGEETPDPGDGADEQPTGSLPLAGAVFGLYNKQGQKLAELETGEDGSASYTLPQGEYVLKELAAPESYIPTDELIPFAIETQAQVVEKSVANTRGFGVIRVVKSGEDEPLEGVTFAVHRASTGDPAGELLTDETGAATLELPLGRYYLVETGTPEGYLPLPGQVSFHLVEEDATVELPISNQRQQPQEVHSGIRLIKKSAADSSPLAFAVFHVFAADSDEKVGEMVTGPDGTATISLPAGEYVLREHTPPQGFLLSEEPVLATVVEDAFTELTVTNTPETVEEDGELRIIKHAAGTGERLQGARFGLFDALTDKKITDLTTDESGIASLKLPAGDYYTIELEAPAGFTAKKEPIAFPILAGETQKLTVANEPELPEPAASGTVEFVKEAKDTGEKLAGAMIGVYSAASGDKVAELTTATNGTVSYKLAVGEYTWKELRSPAGYQLLDGAHSFTVAADKVERITVVNTPLPEDKDTGTFRLVKKAAGSGAAIPDTVFGVYTKANKKLAELTTDDGGEAELALEPGDYYIVELSAPRPYVLETTKIPVSIKDVGKEVLVELSNTKGVGTLRLEKKDTAGKLLSGAVFSLQHSDGKRIAELTVGQEGFVTYDLPVGEYVLVEKTAPIGYAVDDTRHSVSISHQKTSTVTVINEPLQGTVEVYFRHTADKRELADMVSLTDRIGADYILWMRQNGYENMPIEGYTLVGTDYPSSLLLIDGVLEVTLWYDGGDAAPVPGSGGGGIGTDIPKTGIPFPLGTYGLSALCWVMAAGCGVALYRLRRPSLRVPGAPMIVETAEELFCPEPVAVEESSPAEPAVGTPQSVKVTVRRVPREEEA